MCAVQRPMLPAKWKNNSERNRHLNNSLIRLTLDHDRKSFKSKNRAVNTHTDTLPSAQWPVHKSLIRLNTISQQVIISNVNRFDCHSARIERRPSTMRAQTTRMATKNYGGDDTWRISNGAQKKLKFKRSAHACARSPNALERIYIFFLD